MKIIIASHTYIVDLNRDKLKALTNLESNIEVIVIVPKRWSPGGVQNTIIESQPDREGNFQVIPVSNFSQNNQGILTFGLEIIPLLRKLQPDIIQVEQGAKSLGYAQLITLNSLLRLKAKNIFFTWWNLPYQNKFPISLLEKYNLDRTHGLIVGNQDGAVVLKEHGYQGKIKIMPQLGVDEKLFSPRSQPELAANLGIELDEFVIGFVGRFVEEKGILTLINALEGLSKFKWKLLLLGRGRLKEEIVAKATEINLQDRLKIVESVPHNRVPCYINLMSVLVLPSETSYKFKTLTAIGWKEQFGHVLIEAMASKIPVIGSDSGEIPFVIDNAGMVFPEGNVSALRDCLFQLIEQPEFRKQLAEKGYKRAMELYTNQALARQQLDFYHELLTS